MVITWDHEETPAKYMMRIDVRTSMYGQDYDNKPTMKNVENSKLYKFSCICDCIKYTSAF